MNADGQPDIVELRRIQKDPADDILTDAEALQRRSREMESALTGNPGDASYLTLLFKMAELTANAIVPPVANDQCLGHC